MVYYKGGKQIYFLKQFSRQYRQTFTYIQTVNRTRIPVNYQQWFL